MYDDERERRRENGEDWPSAQALGDAYGHWLSAVRAAMRFWFEGGAGRVPAGYEHAVGRQPGYEGVQIVRVLARWFWEFGDWPTEWEYEEWRSLQLLAWRRAGLSDRRLPGLKQVRTSYRQGFAGAVSAAQRWVDRGGG